MNDPKLKTDYSDLTLAVDTNEDGKRTFRGEFAFSGKDAVGHNGLWLPSSKYQEFAGQTLRLRMEHNGAFEAIGVGLIGVNNRMAWVEGEMLETPLAQSFNAEADLTASLGGKMAASIANIYDWNTIRQGKELNATARRHGAQYEYDILRVSHLAFVEAGNIGRANVSVNEDELPEPELYKLTPMMQAAIEASRLRSHRWLRS